MRVVAASLTERASSFLHAGYISAYPRSVYPDAYPVEHQAAAIQVDVAEALRLQGEQLASAATGGGDLPGALAAVASSPQWLTLAAATLATSGLLAAYYLVRDRVEGPGRRRVFALAALTAVGVIAACGAGDQVERAPAATGGTESAGAGPAAGAEAGASTEAQPDALPAELPWEGVAKRTYANPELATTVLLHGIIADGLINVGQPVESLANIQNEVGLPVSSLTEGESYALQTYGRDGWGNDFRFEVVGQNQDDDEVLLDYQITSAGADGVLETADDVSQVVSQVNDGSFDYDGRHAWFLVQQGDEQYVFFHRWSGSFFEYRNEQVARQMTGGDLFDVLTRADLSSAQCEAAATTYGRFAAEVEHQPLILEVYETI